MNIAARIARYRAIESRRARPLIVYATSTRRGVPGQMAGDAVRFFIDQIDAIVDGVSVDVLINSTGGDALTAWKLMSVLRERFERIAVLVPLEAFSAATIFALGADEIVMHPHASLGPIDPQVTIRQPDGGSRRFSFEDVGAFLRFVSDEVTLTEQAHMAGVVSGLLQAADPLVLGGAKRASELATDVGERLLQTHMTAPEERGRAREIAENLNKSFFAHGDAVSRGRARLLDLKVADDDPALEALIWAAYVGIEEYMETRRPFVPLEHFVGNGGADALRPTAPIAVPPNAPQQVVNQIWSAVAQSVIAQMAQHAVEVDYSLVNALIESPRTAAECRTTGKLSALRQPSGEIKLLGTDYQSGWHELDLEAAAA
jgi:hypothetical protein